MSRITLIHLTTLMLLLTSRQDLLAQKSKTTFPIQKEGKFEISLGDQVMRIDPSKGGRISNLILSGEDFLTDSTINNFNWGSTFWFSPQSDWNWPPSAEIDNKPYTASMVGDVVKMISQKDSKTGLVVTKEISADAKSGSFVLKFIITNHSRKPQKVAPWEVTRVKTNGLAFFPVGKDSARGGLMSSTEIQDGIFYYSYQKDKLPLKGDRQIYADGSEGWLAQVNGDVILVKKFPDISLEQTAPKEGEVELFASEVSDTNPGYVEIEHQGPYSELAPNASSVWVTRWFLRKLPANIPVQAGGKPLVDYVRTLVK
ncbi:DUF4380 domain-containing protein [Dyadobacter luticola]|uniref:DUF4380 domain-containing protein n=1 Tax=Dyadobacter luticola TaxID=1979387 RepID=A0A5R9L2B7_9BACT|nr:DUF4380 domain-containing protein [Dyadobacter luticola]TLV02527.1 DUF4380 domain-containing protein [Dyadobacter luticola]